MRDESPFVFAALLLASSLGSQVASAEVWTETSAPLDPAENYERLACSADGATVLAVQSAYFKATNAVYLSHDSGFTWMTNAIPGQYWKAAGCSADGQTLIVMSSSGQIYNSTNAGATWRSNSVPGAAWCSVAGSADGTTWVAAASAVENNAPIYSSADSGATWTPASAPTSIWISVAASADGNTLTAVGLPGVCLSTNRGLAWHVDGTVPKYMSGCACSADGKRIVVGGHDRLLWVTANSGASWVSQTVPLSFTYVTASADATRLAVISDGLAQPVSLSSDCGATWSTNSIPVIYWRCVASSADGHRFFAGGAGRVYTCATPPQPVINAVRSSNNLILSWIVPSVPLGLQESGDLITTNWSAVAVPPVFNHLRLEQEVRINPLSDRRFYRLAP